MSKTTFTLKRKQFGFVGNMFGAKNWNNLKQTGTAVNLATKKEVGVNAQGKVLSGGYKAGQIAAGGAKALGSTALVAGGLAIGTGLAAKGVVNKASEQSDGSKMFSQVNKNDMATTYTLKRKTYSEEEGKKSGMSTAGKIALGAGATALAFAGARRGLMGTGLQKSTNKLWASAGKKIGSQGMIDNAAKKYGTAIGKESAKNAASAASKKNITMTNTQLENIANKRSKIGEQAFLNHYAGKKPVQRATGAGVSLMQSALNKM